MPRTLNNLTARKVQSLTTPGRYADGGGLYLRITKAGGKSWVFMLTRSGKRQEIGLGAASSVSLTTARSLATEMRDLAARGLDPRTALTKEPEDTSVMTFAEFAEEYIASVESGWRNPVHRQQWRSTIRDHAKPIAKKPVGDINTEDVLLVLKPIWTEIPETASRLRGRIERILNAAKVRGLRPIDAINPAQWKGHLEFLLPRRQKLTRGHHAALAWKEAPAFMIELSKRDAVAARALEFTILTAARSGEVLGATWAEVDLKNKLWTIPAGRMKASVEHVIPLSERAIQSLLANQSDERDSGMPLFARNGRTLSNMSMSALLKRMDYDHITVHGFRSTFRDWAGDATDYPRDVVEQALAHAIANKVEAAYRRGKAVEKRQVLMEDWASFLDGAT